MFGLVMWGGGDHGNFGKKWRVIWSQGKYGMVCQGTKPHIRLVWPCGYLFEAFSPTGPSPVNKSFPCHNCYLHHHPHFASSSASSSNGYSNSFLCHCQSSGEDRRLLQPICIHHTHTLRHHKFNFTKKNHYYQTKTNRSQKAFFHLYKIPNLVNFMG